MLRFPVCGNLYRSRCEHTARGNMLTLLCGTDSPLSAKHILPFCHGEHQSMAFSADMIGSVIADGYADKR